MNFTFTNPLILFGLTATILPILIHRITQKRAVVRKFSALRLLLQSQVITARPQRLKHLILLAMRILAVAALAFMMAMPVFHRPGNPTLLRDGATVLILDNSLSMSYQEEGGKRYDRAQRAAKEALQGFRGQAAVIPTAGIGKDQGFSWHGPDETLRELETIPLTLDRGNTASAMAAAYQHLKNVPSPKQILVLSDLARSDWEGLDLTKLGVIPDADVTFIRIGGPNRDANFCIKNVRLGEGGMVAGVPTRLEVTLSNRSNQTGTALVHITLSGRSADQKSIELSPGQDGTVFFSLVIEKPGWVDGEVRLTPDRLSADDVFYFPLKVNEKIKVLIVDGDPKTSLKGSESYYLVNALRPGGLEGSPFLIRVITEREVAMADLRFYDALFLLNVAKPDFSRLASFLESGRPVFLFLGDKIVPETYNSFPLASWQIREKIDLNEQAGNRVHPDTLFGPPSFLAPLQSSLKNASFHTYFKVEGTTKNLLALSNHDPLLVETAAGRSKLFLFASSADLGWNDLPLNAAFLPLLQGLVKNAVWQTDMSLPAGITLGEPFPEETQPLQKEGPREGTGIFQFRLPTGEMRRGVNTPPEESDLVKVTTAELKKKFGALDINVVEYGQDGLMNLQEGRKELWPSLLGFLLAVLGMEMLYANGIPRFKKRSL